MECRQNLGALERVAGIPAGEMGEAERKRVTLNQQHVYL